MEGGLKFIKHFKGVASCERLGTSDIVYILISADMKYRNQKFQYGIPGHFEH
jgi:hypothetical protein